MAENRLDWKAAKMTLEAWLEDEPSNAQARQRLGKALFGLREFDQAYESLQQAAKADPKLEPAAVSMGWLFTRSGNAKKAGEWMDYAAKIAPESLPVQLGVAAWLLEQGRGDEARSHVDVAVKLDPASIEVERRPGLAAWERKDLLQAEKAFQASPIKLPPTPGPAISWPWCWRSRTTRRSAGELASSLSSPSSKAPRPPMLLRRSEPSTTGSIGSMKPRKSCRRWSPVATETPTQPMFWPVSSPPAVRPTLRHLCSRRH